MTKIPAPTPEPVEVAFGDLGGAVLYVALSVRPEPEARRIALAAFDAVREGAGGIPLDPAGVALVHLALLDYLDEDRAVHPDARAAASALAAELESLAAPEPEPEPEGEDEGEDEIPAAALAGAAAIQLASGFAAAYGLDAEDLQVVTRALTDALAASPDSLIALVGTNVLPHSLLELWTEEDAARG